jgi:hypothetical protein
VTAWIVLATCGPAALIGLCWFRRICVDYLEAGRLDAVVRGLEAEIRRRNAEQAIFDDQFAQIIAALERRP